MDKWIDHKMLIEEIEMRRRFNQMRIKELKELRSERTLTPYEEHLYSENVGQDICLMALESWCNDSSFTTEELREIKVL